jgi:outer membrane protein OmpA-like peptidoglycan-associated protein
LLFAGLIISLPGRLAAQSTPASPSTAQEVGRLIALVQQGEQIKDSTASIRNINFELDSDQLEPDVKHLLDTVVTFLRLVENADLVVKGHTDNQGPDAYNQQLSERRAQAVRQYLLAGLRNDPSISDTALTSTKRIQIKGLGESVPIADNATAAGRSENRRVEFSVSITRAVLFQDLIFLCKGDTLAVRIDTIEADLIRYRDFASERQRTVKVLDVCWLVWGKTGERVEFNKPEPEPEPEREPRKKLAERLTFFHCPHKFAKGSGVLMLGGELINNLEDGLPLPYYDWGTPPLSLTYEHGLTCNLGLGLTLAGRYWGNDFADLLYYSATARLVWHFRLHPRLDPYVGITGTVRAVTGTTENEAVTNANLSANGLIGLRVYLTQRWGLFVEGGSDAIARMRAGAFVMLRQ